MATTPYLKRRYQPQETFKSKFESAVYKIVGQFLETDIFKHSLTKGEEREVPIIEFLTQNLPKTYSVVKGEVVDLRGDSSPQLDVMIFDAIRNIPFYTGDNYILPAEALLASVEVKSKLNQEEIRKILKNVHKLKSIKPFGRSLDTVERGRKIEDQVNCRYYHCVFAYSTDLIETDWLTNEFDRIKRVAAEEKIDFSLIDRLIVLDRGLYNLSNSTGTESKDNAQLFMYFYMHLLNYIQRENSRRQRVPYLDYAGKMSNGWTKL